MSQTRTAGGIGSGAIRVVEYDRDWPRLFRALETGLLCRLGGLAAEVHHVGSTAVPGLCAKPKIDIDVALDSEERLAEAIERVRALDCTFHGDPYGDGMWTFTQGRGSYGARIYLCRADNPVHVGRILFRDWLRAHADTAATYAALKLRLAVEAGGDWGRYTGGKSDFVTGIVRLAQAERRGR